jgi:hypothetical protein
VGFEPTTSGPKTSVFLESPAPQVHRAHFALWYPVGGIVFPDQAVQRVVATSLF